MQLRSSNFKSNVHSTSKLHFWRIRSSDKVISKSAQFKILASVASKGDYLFPYYYYVILNFVVVVIAVVFPVKISCIQN